MTSDEEEDVHHPPDAQSSKCQQLAHPSPREAETEPVEAQEPEEDGVQERGHEVVVGVADAREPVPQERPRSGALDTVQHTAAGRGLLDLLPPLTSVSETPVTHLVVRGLVALVVMRLRALQELARKKVARNQWRS